MTFAVARRWTCWGSFVAAVALLIVAAVLHLEIEDRSDAEIATSHETLRAWNTAGASGVSDRLVQIEEVVAQLADDLGAGRIDVDDTIDIDSSGECASELNRFTRSLSETLCYRASGVPSLNGLGVVFLDTELDGYRPYATRAAGPLGLRSLAAVDLATTDWVRRAVDIGPGWTRPRFGVTSKALLALYSQEFMLSDGTTGVILASYALDQLTDDLRWSGPSLPGYSFVIDADDQLISHPHRERVRASVHDGATATGVPAAVIGLGGRQDNVVPMVDDLTDQSALVATTQIRLNTATWTLATVVIEEDLGAADGHHKLVIWRGGALIMAVTCVGLALISTRSSQLKVLWGGAIWIAVGALIATIWVWNVAAELPYERANLELADLPTSESDDLSVGIFVQSIEFTGANDVSVSGLMWQELRGAAEDVDTPGFTFPEADQIIMEEQYRSISDDGVVRIGWSFTASLRQSFDYSRYPFDSEPVWLRIWPGNYSLDQRLVPDVTSYETLAPSTKPGVEDEIIVEGWNVVATSFSYGSVDSSTGFTRTGEVGADRSDLLFNVHLRRSFLDVLLSKLVVLGVVTVLLFGVLLVTHFGVKDQEQSGFSTLSVLGYSASLFFVTIIAHDSLRDELRAQEIIYLEYFYFTTYATILLVSLNAIIVGWSKNKVLQWCHNLLPALLFWPLQGIAVMAITYSSFGGG